MKKITAETAGGTVAFETDEGRKLVLAIEDNGIDILHRCGGNARCTTCRVEVLGGLERLRRWSEDDKARIVEETLAPGAKVTEVARRSGVAASLVFTWRRQARTAERVVPCFAPVQITAAVETGEENSKPSSEDDRRMRQLPAARNGLIEIDLGNRRRIRVDAPVDPEALARVLDVLERR